MPKPKQDSQPDLVQQICMEVIPSQKLTPENFFRLCAHYPRREAASVYLYRLWPIIDRRLGGQRYKNIDKFPVDEKPIDEERILALHGSGKYRLTFNDANRPRPLKQVAETALTLERADRPPVVVVQELILEHPDNRSYVQGLRAAGQLKDEPMNGEGRTAVEQLAAMTRQLMQERGVKREEALAIKLVELLKPSKDPLEMAVQLQKMSEGRKDDTILKSLIDAYTGLTAALIKERAETKGSELEAVDRILGVAGKLGMVPRAGRGGTDWGAVIKESLGNLFLGLPAAIRELRRMASTEGATIVARALPAAGETTAPPEPAPNSAGEPEETEEEEDSETGGVTFQEVTIVGQRAVEAYRAGKSGAEFGAALRMVQPELYQRLRSVGKAGILAGLSAAPEEISEQLESERQKVEAWLDSFFE